VENNPYDPSLMVFMDYRDCFTEKFSHMEEENPTFLYAMPMSSTRVFFEVSMKFMLVYCWSNNHNFTCFKVSDQVLYDRKHA
jgi:hypothetical protein